MARFTVDLMQQPQVYHRVLDADRRVELRAMEARGAGVYALGDLTVRLTPVATGLAITVQASETQVETIELVWPLEAEGEVRILGDAWERGYGELEWRGIRPERVLPWYFAAAEADGGEGRGLFGAGVKVGCGAFVSFKVQRRNVRLLLDCRNGGAGVELGGRELAAATLVWLAEGAIAGTADPAGGTSECIGGAPERIGATSGLIGMTAYETVQALCRKMCDAPRLPKAPVYGSNNWYYAYGKSSHEEILRDSKLIAELTEGIPDRPYMVIDDGWQVCHNSSCNGGPWMMGNYLFPDMAGLAQEMKALDVRPGIWCRPLASYEDVPRECVRRVDPHSGAQLLDPSHPHVLALTETMMRRFADWGYELIKHDFSTVDVFDRWAPAMGDEMTDPGWHFYDRTKTTAEIITEFYRAVRRGAGEDVVLIGCNTVSHLAAGIHELMRTGDDTSGFEWSRTRLMGVNTLAFRMPQHGVFYQADADCVGHKGRIPWAKNRQWLELLARSGTPLFVSVDPEVVNDEQKADLREAMKLAAVPHTARPLDWMRNTAPEIWEIDGEIREFDFSD